MSNTDKIYYVVENNIGEIILNQPEKRNAISAIMWASLKDCIRTAEQDSSCKLVVIRGEGDHFAAGADISEFKQTYATRESAATYTKTMLDTLATLEGCTKPTIAAIRGACVGGGYSIALACDFRIANDKCRVGITPGKLGLVYSLADTRRLSQTVGISTAKELLLTGRLTLGADALALGLVDKLFDDEKYDQQLATFADEIITTSQWSAQATKKTFAMLEAEMNDDDPKALSLMLESFDGVDFKEGYNAFLEKRKPKFPFR